MQDVDAVLIGPHDLSCSLGRPEDYSHPEFDAAVRRIVRMARDRGVAAGIHWWGDREKLRSWIADGLNFVIYSADILSLRAHIGTEVATLRAGLSSTTRPAETDTPI